MIRLLPVFLCLLTFVLSALNSSAQNTGMQPERLKVFIDCQNARCDMQFIRSEINVVDFLLDNEAADLHILITDYRTGGDGRQYQFIFFGQNRFHGVPDTLRFSTDPNGTEFEDRNLFIKYLKLGLAPYLAKTNLVSDVKIDLKSNGERNKDENSPGLSKKDPWNYWVFSTGINGHVSTDEVYKTSEWEINLSANRVTEDLKVEFRFDAGKNRSTYSMEDDNNNSEKIVIKNDNFNFQHSLVKSLSKHWSWGYEGGISKNTFSNNKNRIRFETGIEYNIFPYSEVNTKLFTISYTVDVRRNHYIDTTLYEKISETLWGHGLESNLSLNQKWGTLGFGLDFHNYFQNWNYFNLGVDMGVDIRITGGLSFNIFASGELTHDQLYLPKEGATPEEILTRKRQLASGYNIFSGFGLTYRFGSKTNNFINPRFN